MFSSVTFVSCGNSGKKSNQENNNSGQDSKSQNVGDRDEADNIKITAVNFPDSAFRAYIYDEYGADGVLSDEEIDNVIELELSCKKIKSLEGIEFFPLLEKLECSYNQLTSLDMSKNTALKELWCNGNQLASLDVSKNTKLTELFYDNSKVIVTGWPKK